MKSLIAGFSLIVLGATGVHAGGPLDRLPPLPKGAASAPMLVALTGAIPKPRVLPWATTGGNFLVRVKSKPECNAQKYHGPGAVITYDPDKFEYTPEYLKVGRGNRQSRAAAIAEAEQRFADLVTPKVLEMLRLANEVRRKHGLSEMRLEPRLTLAAKRHNIDIARHALMQHTGTDCSQLKDRVWDAGYTWTKIAENLAGGNETAAATMGQWTSSKRHLEQMTIPAMTEAGIAYDYNPHPPRGGIPIKHFWTLILARPDPWRDRRDGRTGDSGFNDHLKEKAPKKSRKGQTSVGKKS